MNFSLSLSALGGAFARQPHPVFFCIVAVMTSAMNNASSYLAGMRDEVRSPVLRSPTVATAGISADDETRSVEQEQALRCQRELGESNVECEVLRESMVSLQLENQQLQSNAFLCEGRTACEWHEYPVDLQKGYEKLVKEMHDKNTESDELRQLNQGLEKAHRTAVKALEALQISHTAVLIDRDRLLSAGGSETHEPHNKLASINSNTSDSPSSRMALPSSHTTPSTKHSAQSFMSAVRAEVDKSATPSTDVRGIQDGYNENDEESDNSRYDDDDSAPRLAHSDGNTDSDEDSHNVDGRARFYYLTVPHTAENRSILAGLGRDVWRVCDWDASRDQLTFGGGSAAPFPYLDKSEVEWARLKIYSRPSRSGSVATMQDICGVVRRTTGELVGAERSLVPVRKGKTSKAYYAVARGHNVGVYHNFVEVQQQTE